MKNISKDEFKQAIKRLINGEITKVKLAKELETDPRTLDNRIQELSATDPELYYEYVDVLPYKQKGIDHIDFEALVIYMLKNGCTAELHKNLRFQEELLIEELMILKIKNYVRCIEKLLITGNMEETME